MFRDPSLRTEMAEKFSVSAYCVQICGRKNISISVVPKALKYSNHSYEGEKAFCWGQK